MTRLFREIGIECAMVISAREVSGITMCRTEVKGQSHLVAVSTLMVDDKDPLKAGFSLE